MSIDVGRTNSSAGPRRLNVEDNPLMRVRTVSNLVTHVHGLRATVDPPEQKARRGSRQM